MEGLSSQPFWGHYWLPPRCLLPLLTPQVRETLTGLTAALVHIYMATDSLVYKS